MKLARGTRLGPYEIDHAIGSGGMGVVYRADDSRLGRKVAIKILPTAGTEELRRFEREARTIGALNHPILLTLFDVGEHDGIPFLVTEMLEGETLRARMGRGPIKLRDAVQIGADVARGLAAAHGAHIVHRDIKPDNIFITTDNRTKILDFGIAKLRRATESGIDIALEPTTRDTGVIIGTPGYMSPEQLDGGEIDERTDIFALGVVLYEMICGKRAFASGSPVEESYAILKTTPDPPKGATKSLARVVMRCLEKRPDARFQSATDLAFALDELDASTDPIQKISRIKFELEPAAPTIRDSAPPVIIPAGPGKKWLAITGLVAIAAVLSGILIQRALGSRGLRPSWPSVVEGGAAYTRVTYHSQPKWNARLAPDGKSVFYTTLRGGRDEVVRTTIGQPSILPTTIAGTLFAVSNRGELAIQTDPHTGTLARVIEGSGPRALADGVTAAAWFPDDTLAIIHGAARLEYPIGTPLLERKTGELDLLRVAPTGDRIAFAEHAAVGDNSGAVVVVDRTGKELLRSPHQEEIEGLAWTPDGDEVWFSNAESIYGIDRAGHLRTVLHGINRLVLHDIRPDRILVAPSTLELKMFTGPRDGPYRDAGWFDTSIIESTTTDGASLLFVEGTGTAGTNGAYAHFLRRGDAPATLIANGFASVMLPDASAVISIASTTKLVRIPTGVGTPTPIDLGRIAQLELSDRLAVSWTGRYVVLRGAEAGGAMRLWRIDLTTGEIVAIAAAHSTAHHPISPDGNTVAIAGATSGIELVSLAGRATRVIEGPVEERPLSFTGNGAGVFVSHLAIGTIEVDLIDLETGTRKPWARFTPDQRPAYHQVVLDPEGATITYSTSADTSDLYVLQRPAD